jgi:hypothetical protein
MNIPDENFLNCLFDLLIQAPRTQIDEDIVANIKIFISEPHTLQEKYDFIQNISKEPLNMISDQIGVGRITPFVKQVCDLDTIFKKDEIPVKLIPEEIIVTIDDDLILKKGEVIKYGWDGKPIICKDESEKSKISVEYIIANQGKDKEERVMVEIFTYMEDLMWAGKFNVVDEFIYDFCKHDVCFQYYICLLTAACWVKDKLKNIEELRFKAKEIGYKEIGEKDTDSCLKGLL